MTDLATLQEKLEKSRAETEKLAQQLEEARTKQLTDLPAQLGFDTVDQLIKALVEHASPVLKGKLRAAMTAGQPGATRGRRGRPPGGGTQDKSASGENAGGGDKGNGRAPRTRAKITPETKEKVRALVAEEKTGAEIAKALGISLPSVQNIKKELGLVKKRK